MRTWEASSGTGGPSDDCMVANPGNASAKSSLPEGAELLRRRLFAGGDVVWCSKESLSSSLSCKAREVDPSMAALVEAAAY